MKFVGKIERSATILTAKEKPSLWKSDGKEPVLGLLAVSNDIYIRKVNHWPQGEVLGKPAGRKEGVTTTTLEHNNRCNF